MRLRKLQKRVLVLEGQFDPVDEEFDVDWERLSEQERAIIRAAARVEIKYRKQGAHGITYDFTEASAEEKAQRTLAQAIMQKHLEKKSEIEKRRGPMH